MSKDETTAGAVEQTDRELAEMIAKFRTYPTFNWKPLADDIETVLNARAVEIARLRTIAHKMLGAFPSSQTHDQEDVWVAAYDALHGKGKVGMSPNQTTAINDLAVLRCAVAALRNLLDAQEDPETHGAIATLSRKMFEIQERLHG